MDTRTVAGVLAGLVIGAVTATGATAAAEDAGVPVPPAAPCGPVDGGVGVVVDATTLPAPITDLG